MFLLLIEVDPRENFARNLIVCLLMMSIGAVVVAVLSDPMVAAMVTFGNG